MVILHRIGGVAQVVRACGSYPQCPGFESLHRHLYYSSSLFLIMFLVDQIAFFHGKNDDFPCYAKK